MVTDVSMDVVPGAWEGYTSSLDLDMIVSCKLRLMIWEVTATLSAIRDDGGRWQRSTRVLVW